MKGLLTLTTGLLLVFFLIVNVNATPLQFNETGNWYEVVLTDTDQPTWTEAKTIAELTLFNGLDGHLATVTSQSEWTFIQSLDSFGNNLWLGGTDNVTEGSWAWVTGEAFTFTAWASGEPNNVNNEDYLETWQSGNTWNDIPVTGNNVGYIIEFEGTSPVPEPSTMLLFGIGLFGLAGVSSRRKH